MKAEDEQFLGVIERAWFFYRFFSTQFPSVIGSSDNTNNSTSKRTKSCSYNGENIRILRTENCGDSYDWALCYSLRR